MNDVTIINIHEWKTDGENGLKHLYEIEAGAGRNTAIIASFNDAAAAENCFNIIMQNYQTGAVMFDMVAMFKDNLFNNDDDKKKIENDKTITINTPYSNIPSFYPQPQYPTTTPERIYWDSPSKTTPNWFYYPSYTESISNFPDACKSCSNNPANGGSGICHCILGQRVVY